MIYDLLFGQGIKGGGGIKKILMQTKSTLVAALVRIKVKCVFSS